MATHSPSLRYELAVAIRRWWALRRRAKLDAKIAAKWSRCCRCFPSDVGADGYCSCCGYNHVTGECDDWSPPDYFSEPTGPVEVGDD